MTKHILETWLQEALVGTDTNMVDHLGPRAVNILIADPDHRVVRLGAGTAVI